MLQQKMERIMLRVYTEFFRHIPLTFVKIAPVFPDFRLKIPMFFTDPTLQNILFP